jgi:hypothetical protein
VALARQLAPTEKRILTLECGGWLKQQKLDVAQHVPIHGRVGSNDEFLKIVSQAGAQSR